MKKDERTIEDALLAYGIPPLRDLRLPPWGAYQPLPMGLATADYLITVSPTYAQEIKTPEFGCGLQDFLRQRSDNITGILNGLDQQAWDPQTDTALTANYARPDIAGRQANKQALLREFALPQIQEMPLLILIGDKDDWARADRCRTLQASGFVRPDLVEAVYYPNAVHAFDVVGMTRRILSFVETNGVTKGGLAHIIDLQCLDTSGRSLLGRVAVHKPIDIACVVNVVVHIEITCQGFSFIGECQIIEWFQFAERFFQGVSVRIGRYALGQRVGQMWFICFEIEEQPSR